MLISAQHATRYDAYYRVLDKPLRPHRWQERVEVMARGMRHVLDYGCGRQRLSTFSSLPVVDYDPGIPVLSALPKPCDFVVCLHVLEHVEDDCIDDVLEHLESLALKRLLIAVSCEPGHEMFEDGQPLHCFVRPYQWWEQKLARYLHIQPVLKGGKEFAAVFNR